MCRELDERARVLDMNRRLLPYARVAIVLLLLAGIAGVPAYGWRPLAAMLLAAACHEAVQRRLSALRRPELALVVMLIAIQTILAGGIALAHGPQLFLLSILTFPLMFAAAVFPIRIGFLVTVLSLVLLLAVGLGLDAVTVWHLPPILLCAAINLVTLPLIMEAACALDAESRSTVVVDPLTGLLNRVALAPRLAELRTHAEVTGLPVAVIVGDLDRFKLVNDEHGHAAGDVALKEVAYCLRKGFGPFQQIYRLGGEEFLILLADTDAHNAGEVADQLRQAIAAPRAQGPQLTMSFGTADSSPEEGFDFESVFKRADAALYDAKGAGRNRVRIAGHGAESSVEPVGAARPTAGVLDPAQLRRDVVAREAPTSGARVLDAQRRVDRHGSDRSWLIPDAISRAHLLDLAQRLTHRAAGGYALGFVSVLVAAPYYGWWILVPGFVTGVIFNLIISQLDRFRRPEYALGLGALLAQTGGACGLLVAHGEILFDLPVLVALVAGVSVVLPARGVVIGVLFTVAAMAGVAVVHGGHQIAANPSLLVLPVALTATVGLIGAGVGRSDTDHRGLAIIDPLTGMLNRAALETKRLAVTHAANLTGEPVAIAVGDLDHFKALNDRYGHAVGDAALSEVAARIRSRLRAFESAYRVGGEEFVVLLPGAVAADAAALAERIRVAVSQEPIEGVPVTISIGVAASEPGEPFDYDALFAVADAALYKAKREGRNRVHCPSTKGPRPRSRHPVAA